MGGFTNIFKRSLLEKYFRTTSVLHLALVTGAIVPNADINKMSDLVEIDEGNGYLSGGESLVGDETDFPDLIEDDSLDQSTIAVRMVTFTPVDGPIPGTGDPARYAVLTDDNDSVDDRMILAYADLQADRVASLGQPMELSGLKLSLTD